MLQYTCSDEPINNETEIVTDVLHCLNKPLGTHLFQNRIHWLHIFSFSTIIQLSCDLLCIPVLKQIHAGLFTVRSIGCNLSVVLGGKRQTCTVNVQIKARAFISFQDKKLRKIKLKTGFEPATPRSMHSA